MKATHKDVLASVQAWMIGNAVKCKEINGKTELMYRNRKVTFPHWLALQKVNMIGANQGIAEIDLFGHAHYDLSQEADQAKDGAVQ